MSKITPNNYGKLLTQLQKIIEESRQDIIRAVTNEKIEMSWNIGKIINKYLLAGSRSDYGDQLFVRLEQDSGITKRALYQMSGFHKTYPDFSLVKNKLSWSHYRNLITIKDEEERQYFEALIDENSLSSNRLQSEIAKYQQSKKSLENKSPDSKPLSFRRGKIFAYKIIETPKNEKLVDCGFKIFREIESLLGSEDGILRSFKGSKDFTLQKSAIAASEIHTYKATVDKVVDGDTLNVTLDLGFKIRHKEILRLAKINAPEKNTLEGEKSTAALKKILAKVEFLVIKTLKTDIYGRYVADIFFLEGENNVEKVASDGVYLNQLLLDESLVEKY